MSEETQIRRLPTAMIVAVAVQTLGGLIWAGGAAARKRPKGNADRLSGRSSVRRGSL